MIAVSAFIEGGGARLLAAAAAASLVTGGCASEPLAPYAADGPALALLPVSQAGVRDARGRFREIFEAVLEARGSSLPDWRPCEEALTRVGDEPAGTGAPIELGASRRGLVVSYPRPERISSVLTSSYEKLCRIDGRNDSQLLCYDQVIPGSTLVAYLDADHWAVAVPVAREHPVIASMFVDQNDYPREALVEALLRFMEEDLARSGG